MDGSSKRLLKAFSRRAVSVRKSETADLPDHPPARRLFRFLGHDTRSLAPRDRLNIFTGMDLKSVHRNQQASRTPLQFAEEYRAAGIAPIVTLPYSKVCPLEWKDYQIVGPTDDELEAMFSSSNDLNVALICGTPSGNLCGVDCETPKTFQETLERLDRVRLTDTWIDKTPRGGRVWLRSPVPLRSQKGKDIELLGALKYGLTYPSRFGDKQYTRLHHPPSILAIPALDLLREALPWLTPTEAPALPQKRLPRTARRLLNGRGIERYDSRSEAEQAIVSSLFNRGFEFAEVLALFRNSKATGRLAEMAEADAIRHLRMMFNEAREFYRTESPYRTAARNALFWAASTPWPGKTGSIDRAVFSAHASLAFISAKPDYGASTRDLAEHAACQRSTAQRATRRLRAAGLIELTKPFTYLFSNRYALTASEEKGNNLNHSTYTTCVGVGQSVPFSESVLHDAFRRKALGRASGEVLNALTGPVSAIEIAKTTGRHVKTVRLSLKRLRAFGFVQKTGKLWNKTEKPPDLNEIAQLLGTAGAGARQKQRHRKERLGRKVMAGIYRQNCERNKRARINLKKC